MKRLLFIITLLLAACISTPDVQLGRTAQAFDAACTFTGPTLAGNCSGGTGAGGSAQGAYGWTSGYSSWAYGMSDHAMGHSVVANANSYQSGGIGANARGYVTQALAQGAEASGVHTLASAPAAAAHNEDTVANNWRATAMGSWTWSTGDSALSTGKSTKASGQSSSSFGDSSHASRETQWALAGGNFDNDSTYSWSTTPPGKAHAQTSRIVLRAKTTGNECGETVPFVFGANGNATFPIESGRVYLFRARALIVSSTNEHYLDITATIRGPIAAVLSNTGCADGHIGVGNIGGNAVWTWTTTGTHQVNAVLVVDFDEVVTP